MIREKVTTARGFEDKGWCKSYYTFSFENYLDPEYSGYRTLRVLNEYFLQGGKTLGPAHHQEMEIVTYVLEGSLEYKDTLGQVTLIRPGEVQLLTAGRGVTHQEHNLSLDSPAHFFQLWFYSNQPKATPEISQRIFSPAARWGKWALLLSSNGREGSLRLHQDVDLYATLLEADEEITFDTFPSRYYWLQIISGTFEVQKILLHAGDSLALNEETAIDVKCLERGELFLIDQP